MVEVGAGKRKEGDYLLNEWTEWTGEALSDGEVLAQADEGGGWKEGEREKQESKETRD